MVECEYWRKKNSQAVDRRAVGCKLVVLKMACSQSGYKILRHFLVPLVRAIQGASRCLVS
jgi:hypothetical protein